MRTIDELKNTAQIGDVMISTIKIVEKCLYEGRNSRERIKIAIGEAKGKEPVSDRLVQMCIKHLNWMYDGDNKITKSIKNIDGPIYHLENYDNLCFPDAIFEENKRDVMRVLLRLASIHRIPVRKLFTELKTRKISEIEQDNSDFEVMNLGVTEEPFPKFIQIFSRLFDAICRKELISIDYKYGGRYTMPEKDHEVKTLSPLMLKIFKERWYLIAHEHKPMSYDWSVFPLDRIIEINKYEGNKTYWDKDPRIIEEYYSKVIGFDVPPEKVKSASPDLNRSMLPKDLITTHIEIGFDNAKTYDYVKRNPIHVSQQYRDIDYTIELDLVENAALYRELMRYAPDIKFLYPGSVKDELNKRVIAIIDKIGGTKP